MLFVAAGVTDTKVRHSTGVATTNSTNKNPNANKLSWAINYTFIIIITITQDFIMDIGQIEKTWWWRRLKQQVLVVFSVVMSAW